MSSGLCSGSICDLDRKQRDRVLEFVSVIEILENTGFMRKKGVPDLLKVFMWQEIYNHRNYFELTGRKKRWLQKNQIVPNMTKIFQRQIPKARAYLDLECLWN